MMVVVKEEMQRGQVGRTWPSGNGRDLGTRQKWESKMAQQEARAITQSHDSQGAELADREEGECGCIWFGNC